MTEMENLRAWVQEWHDEANERRDQAYKVHTEGENHKAAVEAAQMEAYEKVLDRIDHPITWRPKRG